MSARLGRMAAPSLTLAVATVLAGCAAAGLPEFDVPERVRTAGRIAQQALPIDVEKEREIGFGIAATVAGRYGVADDPELTRYLNLVGQAVAQQSSRYGEIPFRFAVLETGDVNAFAAPGGYVFVTRGALDLMESEAELAGVLAHEVGHVDEKHVLDEIRRSSVFAQARDETEISGEVLNRLSDFGTNLLFTGLSREDEMEADTLGTLYAGATGYRADGLLRFLHHLREAEAQGSAGMREWLATHPSTEERIAALEEHVRGRGLDPDAGALVRERFRQHVGGREPR